MTSSQRWRHCHLIPSVGESTLTLLHLTHAGLQYRISFPVCRCSHTVHKRSLNGLMSIWMMWILRGGISKSSHLNLKETYDAFLYLFPLRQCFISGVFVCMLKISKSYKVSLIKKLQITTVYHSDILKTVFLWMDNIAVAWLKVTLLYTIVELNSLYSRPVKTDEWVDETFNVLDNLCSLI